MTMRVVFVLLALAGCSSDRGSEPSFNAHLNGVYTTFGGVVTNH